MEEENSRSAASDDEDFEEDPNAEGGYDDEATLDEEEALDDDGEYSDELRELEEEGDLSVEELRRRYGLASDAAPSENVSSSATEVAPGTSTDAGSGSRGYFSDVDEEDENCDEDYIPADPYKKEVRVSEELYQAVIPSLDPLYESSFHTSLLWEPSICNDVSLLEAFLADTRNLRGLTVPPIPDDEDALFALINSQGNIEKALNSFPFPAANGPRLTVRADSQPWTTKEEDLFEEGLRIYEKNFPCIQRSQLPHRSIGELVEHYYSWKKTERYKAFVESRRRVAEDAVAAKAAARVETVDGPPVISEPPTNPSTDGDKQWKHKSEWTKGTKSWNAEEGKWNGAWKESSEALAHV